MSLIESDYDVVNWEAGADSNLRGAECSSCFRLLEYKFFPSNHAYKSGYGPQCQWCLSQPRLSIAEHTARLREKNFNSEGTRRQRHPDQDLMKNETKGEMMDFSLFLQKLHHVYPGLYITPGMVTVDGIPCDISLYATSGVGKSEWGGNSFKYLGYVTIGPMPEFTEYEFDSRDILLRAKRIGWRSVLLRFIRAHILTEEQVNKEFGPPSGIADATLWFKKLHQFRNERKLNQTPSATLD